MRFSILGPVQVTDGRDRVFVRAPQDRKLLALLVLHANRVVSRDEIIDALWGESPPSRAVNAVHYHVRSLRRALGDEQRTLLVTEQPGYVLRVEPDHVDHLLVEDLHRRAQAALESDPETAAALLRRGLALWRGRPLADFEYERFARAAVITLEEMRLALLEDRIAADLMLGRHRQVIPELKALIAEVPMREGIAALLMTALYRSGRQGEALRVMTATRRVLRDELGIDPSTELADLEEQILLRDAALGERQDTPNNLPPAAHIIGRGEELERIATMLSVNRLVTVTGLGGIGKTALAVAAAHAELRSHAHGVWFVELAGLVSARELIADIERQMGFEDRHTSVAAMVALLGSRSMLLVVDHCDHVRAAVRELLSALLSQCSGVQVLVTCREPLDVIGEQVVRLAPLATASPLARPEAQTATASFQLFLTRAQEQCPDFSVTADRAAPVSELCRQLAGIPLAIELAAARIPDRSVEELVAAVSNGGDGQPRNEGEALHVAMETVLHWSAATLSRAAQVLFARLSTFRGSFTAEAAGAVCGFGSLDELLCRQAMAELAASSLVESAMDASGYAVRYRLLEPVRRFAALRLDDRARAEAASRHAAYYVEKGRRVDDVLTSAVPCGTQLAAEDLANHRVAFDRAIAAGDRRVAVQLAAGGYSRYCNDVGLSEELLERVDQIPLTAVPVTPHTVRALGHAMRAEGNVGGPPRGYLERYEAAVAELGDARELALVKLERARRCRRRGQWGVGLDAAVQAARALSTDNDAFVALALREVVLSSANLEELDTAGRALRLLDKLSASRELPLTNADRVGLRGYVAAQAGDLECALHLCAHSVRALAHEGREVAALGPMALAVDAASMLRDAERAMRLARWGEDVARRHGIPGRLAAALGGLAQAAVLDDDTGAAAAACLELSGLVASGVVSPGWCARAHESAARVALARRCEEEAVRLFSASRHCAVVHGVAHNPHARRRIAVLGEDIRRVVGPEHFEKWMREGGGSSEAALCNLLEMVLQVPADAGTPQVVA